MWTNATLLKHTCEDLSCQLGGAACLIVNQFVDVRKSFGISTLTSISTYSARVNTNKMFTRPGEIPKIFENSPLKPLNGQPNLGQC